MSLPLTTLVWRGLLGDERGGGGGGEADGEAFVTRALPLLAEFDVAFVRHIEYVRDAARNGDALEVRDAVVANERAQTMNVELGRAPSARCLCASQCRSATVASSSFVLCVARGFFVALPFGDLSLCGRAAPSAT